MKFFEVYFPIILVNYFYFLNANQLTFTCSNSAIETLEKGVKYVQK